MDINQIIDLAKDIHAIEFRRDGVTPYFTHVERVADRVRKRTQDYYGIEEMFSVSAAAYLHDAVESGFSLERLASLGIDKTIVDAVGALTHRFYEESYKDYLKRVKANEIAYHVKIADILDNLSDNPTNKQISKYAYALTFLLNKPTKQ